LKIKVYSIFNSIDGEVNKYHQGRVCTFIRLAGCNIRCKFCDTKYAQKITSGKDMDIDEVVFEVEKIGCKNVTITGGEPLLQNIQVAELIRVLDRKKYFISVETNGSLSSFQTQLKHVSFVMDYKLPSSGMEKNMRIGNFLLLRESDFIKFVIQDRNDYDRALAVMWNFQAEGCAAGFAFSPVFGVLNPKELVDWIQQSCIKNVVVNLQLHKYIWPTVKEGEEH
jgi:7-carboxy-7-deazaguanine synthase